MDYFSLFELPVQLDVDKKALRAKYLELSRRFHPDYFATSDAAEQDDALQATAQLNKAFKTLSNREETIRYVLNEKGLIERDEKYKLSPLFLMEMLEINEAVADLEFDNDPAQINKVQNQIKQIRDDIYAPVAAIVEAYKEGSTSEKELLQVKDYYFRKKYLERLEQQLSGML